MGMMAFRTETNAKANEVGRYQSAHVGDRKLGILDTKTGTIHLRHADWKQWNVFNCVTGEYHTVKIK